MLTVNDVLDKAAEACSAENDSQLGRALKISPNAVNNYRRGVSSPNAVVCARIAEITGIPLAQVLGIAGEARAISREEKAVWRRLASAAAAMFIALSGLAAFPTNGAPGNEFISRNQAMNAYYVFERLTA